MNTPIKATKTYITFEQGISDANEMCLGTRYFKMRYWNEYLIEPLIHIFFTKIGTTAKKIVHIDNFTRYSYA